MKKSRKSEPAKQEMIVPGAATSPPALQASFVEVVDLIRNARQRAFQAVNTELIDLYWRVGEYISRKLEAAAWGEGVVDQLAEYIARQHPDLKGFTRRNLFRMRQLYEAYRHDEKVSPLLTQLSWTHNLLILSRCKQSRPGTAARQRTLRAHGPGAAKSLATAETIASPSANGV
jgi:hypothetical protein